MARNRSTFGGVHRPVPRDGRAHTLRAAAERANYDNAPATGGSCLLVVGILGATLIGTITATVQVIA
jgi:hypothetical protein